MKADNLFIPPLYAPRMPGVVMAEDLLASAEAFDRLFPMADVVDFTELSQTEQVTAVQKYMQLYHCEGEYTKSEEDRWHLRRLPERTRRAYYLADLCGYDQALLNKIFVTGDWDESVFQTNVLLVSNPEISRPFADIKITDRYNIRFDLEHTASSHHGNFLQLPQDPLDYLSSGTRRKLAHTWSKTDYFQVHDDCHGFTSIRDEMLRAATAGLFRRLPRPFRQEVVRNAAGSISMLGDAKTFKSGADHQEQAAFWCGAYVYVTQYLSSFHNQLLNPFTVELRKIGKTVLEKSNRYPTDLRHDIQKQLTDIDLMDLGAPDRYSIHDPQKQGEAISFLKDEIRKMGTVPNPTARISAGLLDQSWRDKYLPLAFITPALQLQNNQRIFSV